MLNTLALFPSKIDAAALDDLVANAVAALKTADGLLSLEVNEGQMMSAGGPPLYSKVILAKFKSLETFMAWVETPAAQANKDKMVSNGVVRLFFNVAEL